MSINLFLRPLASANIEYEYKTNVLSTYKNLEDRIAQRDVPRITFNYSYMLNDYGMTNELQNALQNNGSVNSFWLPDWFAFVEVSNIVAGTNSVSIDYYNSLTKGEYVLVYADANNYEVTQIDSVDRNSTTCTISFDTTKDFAHACIMPLFECNSVADNKTTYINSLTNTFGVSMMAKQPPLPNILDHDVTFLGHDVFCDNFKVLAEDSEGLEVNAGQQIQENDYEIGIRDRFTFFERMYNTFGLNLCVKQDELEYVRNFLNRRWGMTYACFIPTGSCDFTKVAQTGSIDNVLNVKHSTFDFTHRPYIAIRHGNKVTYAKVLNVVTEDDVDSLTLDSDTMLEVVLNADEQCVSKSLVTALNCTTFDIDSIQVLYFARLNSDAFSFEFVGNSDDNKCVYKIELSFIETEFYDSSLIDYNNYDGIDIDERTLFEVKATTDDWHNIINDNKKSHFASSQSTGGIAPVLIQGKYDGTYAFANMSIVDTEPYIPPTPNHSDHWSDLWMINRDDDFCLQVEGMFVTPIVTAPENQQVSTCATMLTIGDKNEYYGICIKLAWVFDRYYMTVRFDLDTETSSGQADVDTIVLDKYDGDLFDTFHEIAVQRTNGITYVYCDGHLCGSTMTAKNTRLFRAWARGGYRKYFYLNLGNTLTSYSATYKSYTASYVQQARITIKRKVYTHTEMGKMNRQYRLNDYTLTPTVPMDSATVLYEKFLENAVYYRWVLYNGNFYAPDNVNTGGCNHAVHPYARYQRTMVDNANDGWRSWARELHPSDSAYRLSQGHDLSRRAYYPINFKLKMPRMWHKDFWIDFSMSKVGSITNGMTLLNQDGIFLKVWVNSTQTKWMVTAFYEQDPTEEVINILGKPCDNGEIMNVAIALDSQNNALRTFMDGMEVDTINLTYYMEEFNERACISLYPLYIDQCNIKLHSFRIVDACLAHASYTVSDLDKLGFYTTYFDIEFGQREEDKYPCLRVKDIEEIYPLADIYGVIKNTERVKNYAITWSDGTKGDTVVNPTGNTLYTCVVTDLSTGQKGYGWYYVPSGFTGKICETDFSYSLSVDSNGDTVKTNHFSAKRYNFLTRAWENYTVGKYGSPYIDFYTTETNGKGKFYIKKNGYYDYFIDILTNETLRQAGSSSDNNWYAYHRFYVDHYIKQIEFVVIGDYDNPTYIHNNMCYEYISNLFTCQSEMCDDYDEATQQYYWHRYTDYYNGSGSTPAYAQRQSVSRRWYSSSNLKTSITSRYESKYKQGIKYYGMHLSCNSTGWEQGYYPDVENERYYPLMFTNSPKPIHVVLEVEPMIVGGGASGNNVYCNIVSFIRNFWINGKMYDGCKLLKNLDCTNMRYVYYNKLPENPKDFRTYPDGYNDLIRFLCMDYYPHKVDMSGGTEFFNNTLGAIAGRFGDYSNNNSPDGVTGIKLYNFRKYTKDFDASKILKGTDTQPMLPWRT